MISHVYLDRGLRIFFESDFEVHLDSKALFSPRFKTTQVKELERDFECLLTSKN